MKVRELIRYLYEVEDFEVEVEVAYEIETPRGLLTFNDTHNFNPQDIDIEYSNQVVKIFVDTRR